MQRDPKYVLRRITKVLEAEEACLVVELHRRLGEVGQPRLDPRLVDLVAGNEVAKPGGKIVELRRNDSVLYALSATSAVKADYVAEYKALLYQKALLSKDEPANVDALHSMVVQAVAQASSRGAGIEVHVQTSGSSAPGWLVASGTCGGQEMLFVVFASNELKWIYPHSHQVWAALRHCCREEAALPIVIARHFHPGCFGLFKAVGMLGHATYKVWFSPDVWPDFERLTAILGFPTATTESLDDRLLSFFDRTLPSQIKRSLANLRQVSDLVRGFASEEGLGSSDLDTQLRHSVYQSFLAALPSTHLVRRLQEDAAGAWRPP
jgi:hypothetical protein